MRRVWGEDIKQKARTLRESGLSYRQLVRELGVPRSSLHSWLHKIKTPILWNAGEQRKHLDRIRKLAALAHNRIRAERLDKITARLQKEVDDYNLSDLNLMKSMVSMLYWAEGSKGRGYIAFANTDPKLSLLFITLLRKCYKLDESKLRVRIHLHHYHNIIETKAFWSKLLKISEAKFGKIHIKQRSKTKKFRENFAGICFIKYYSEDLRFELLETGRLIAEKLVPVA